MSANKSLILSLYLFSLACIQISAQEKNNYTAYHRIVLVAEEYMATEQYDKALNQLNTIFETYDFVFLKDCKVATQLAIHLGNTKKAFYFLEKGMLSGWTLKAIKKDKFLAPLKASKEWDGFVQKYPALHSIYQQKLDLELRETTKLMYKKDQKFAFKYLFKIGQKAKESFANKKGVAHAKVQFEQLNQIIMTKGYPGEKLIGEPEWVSTILSHHNSISEDFVKNDSLFPKLRPKLIAAISKGELSPYDFAMIEDWRISVSSDRKETGYGYLEYLTPKQIPTSDKLRENLNMRPIALRNQLVTLQEKTGMNFYLAGTGWVDGKIGE